jgi:hypothetical protein
VKVAARVLEMRTQIKAHLPASAPDHSINHLAVPAGAAARLSENPERDEAHSVGRRLPALPFNWVVLVVSKCLDLEPYRSARSTLSKNSFPSEIGGDRVRMMSTWPLPVESGNASHR